MYRTEPCLLNPVSRMIKVVFFNRRGKTFFQKFLLPFYLHGTLKIHIYFIVLN